MAHGPKKSYVLKIAAVMDCTSEVVTDCLKCVGVGSAAAAAACDWG